MKLFRNTTIFLLFTHSMYPLSFLSDFFKPRPINIILAVQNGDFDKFTKYFSAEGADVNICDENRTTPLHWACGKGKRSFFELLLERKANIEVQDKNGRTPLHWASDQGEYGICKLLLDKGANIEACDNRGWTPLIEASRTGEIEVCRLLLERGANISAHNNSGLRAIDIASANSKEKFRYISERGKQRVAMLLFEKEVDKRVLDTKGWTLLHLACDRGYSVICEGLLEGSFDINARTPAGETPLMIACKQGYRSVVQVLLANEKLLKELKDPMLEGTALHTACYYNRADICEALLQAKCSPNERAKSLSLLHTAVEKGSLQLVDLFLEHQKDRNMQDKNGATPLHLSCQLGRDEITEKILVNKESRKININAVTLSGKTSLHYAVENQQLGSVQLLLTYDAQIDVKDNSGKTPLMYAAEKKQLEICRMLKERISVTDFNQVKNFLGSLVRGHTDLEKLFDVHYSDLSVLPQHDSVPVKIHAPLFESMSGHSLPTDIVKNAPSAEREKSSRDDELDDNCADQVSEEDA